MLIQFFLKSKFLLISVSGFLAEISSGAVVVDIFENGSDVFFTVAGGVDVGGLTAFSSIPEGTTSQMTGNTSSSILLKGSGATLPLYVGATPTIAGFTNSPVGLTAALPGPLPTVGISNTGAVFVSPELIGAASSSLFVAQISGTSLASLGIADGVTSSVSWQNGSETESITFRTGSAISVVPEPSGTFYFTLTAMGLTIKRCRRRA